MLPTPSTSHVPYDRVYEPAEDSYLLLDTLSSAAEAAFLRTHLGKDSAVLICEVGTGSGVVLAFATANAEAIFGRTDVLAIGTDLNPFACRSTVQTVQQAIDEGKNPDCGSLLDAVNGSLTAPWRPGQIDVLIFNPPYVPAPLPQQITAHPTETVSSDERFAQDSHLLELSYAGGEDGMEITNQLLDALPQALSARGVAYVLFCAQNKPHEVKTRIESWSESGSEWRADIVGSSGKTAGWEKLLILRISRK